MSRRFQTSVTSFNHTFIVILARTSSEDCRKNLSLLHLHNTYVMTRWHDANSWLCALLIYYSFSCDLQANVDEGSDKVTSSIFVKKGSWHHWWGLFLYCLKYNVQLRVDWTWTEICTITKSWAWVHIFLFHVGVHMHWGGGGTPCDDGSWPMLRKRQPDGPK